TLVVALALAACSGEAPEPQSATDPPTPTPTPTLTDDAVGDEGTGEEPAPGGEAVTIASCSPVESPAPSPGGHLIGDREPPAPYTSVPPTSGWHASGAFTIAVHGPDDPLPEPRQVSVLEAGGVVVAYHDLDEQTRTELEEHVRERYPGRVAVTPYDQLEPGYVAFTAWQTLQRCEGLALAVLDTFVAEHADEEVDTPGTH
ncbi:MAG: DUF3105 domain-containing protein, partial [Egibacteraceae bacterium]